MKVNPYRRLQSVAQAWAYRVIHPRTVFMWRYPKEKLSASWKLDDLWERTMAAQQLGYSVRIQATSEGLIVEYVEQAAGSVPWEIAP